MGGVDHSDQMIKYYEVLRQTKKYWKTLFFHMVDLAVVNSFILYKTVHPQEKISHYQFREKLVRALCPIASVAVSRATTPGSGGRPARDTTVTHYLVRGEGKRNCVYCQIKLGKRTRTTRMCATCKVHLCFSSFEPYHHRSFQFERERLEAK